MAYGVCEACVCLVAGRGFYVVCYDIVLVHFLAVFPLILTPTLHVLAVTCGNVLFTLLVYDLNTLLGALYSGGAT